MRRDLGSEARPAWPACRSRSRSDAAPARLDRTARRAGRATPTRGGPPDPAPPGPVALLPAARRPLRLGNYRHEPILFDAEDLRAFRDGEPMPSVEPFTPERLRGCYRQSVRLMPALAGRVDPCDGDQRHVLLHARLGSIVGESPDVRGLWVCEAVWITHAGGMGRMVAEWIAEGEPSMDLREGDAQPFLPA